MQDKYAEATKKIKEKCYYPGGETECTQSTVI